MNEQATAEVAVGRELDALVAERVMGWTGIYRDGQPCRPCGTASCPKGDSHTRGDAMDAGREHIPNYSTDIAAAWEVVTHLERALGAGVPSPDWMDEKRLHEKGSFTLTGPYITRPWRAGWLERDGEYPLIEGEGTTAPEAICRAALAWAARK